MRKWGMILLASTTALTSCTLVDPYQSVAITPDQYQSSKTQGNANELLQAISFADGVRQSYLEGLREMGAVPEGMAAALIPMAATAGALAVLGNHRHSITTLGFAGAGLLGLGSYLYSRPREQVFLGGATAVGCALDNVAPYRLSPEQMDAFYQARLETGANVQSKMAALKAIAGDKDLVQTSYAADAASDLAKASAALQDFEQQKAASEDAEATLGLAASSLTATVQKIQVEVASHITETEPNIQALSGTLGSLSSIFPAKHGVGTATGAPAGPLNVFTKLSVSGLLKEAPPEKVLAFKAAEADLQIAVGQLLTETAALKVVTTQVKTAPFHAASCPLNVAGSLALSTSISTATANTASSDQEIQVVVSGGEPPYQQGVIGSPNPEKLVIRTAIVGGTYVVTVIVPKGQAGSYKLLVSDKVGTAKVVDINASSK